MFSHVKQTRSESKSLLPGTGERKWMDCSLIIPSLAEDRAHIRALALQIIANTQPLQNQRVLEHFSPDMDKRKAWAAHWIDLTFSAFEKEISKSAGKYSYGDQLTLIDCCIPPQVFNARR